MNDLEEPLNHVEYNKVLSLVEERRNIDKEIAKAAEAKLEKFGHAVVPVLIDILKSESCVLWEIAASELVRIGQDSVPELIKALGYNNFRVGQAAMEALVEIGNPAVPALGESLKDKDHHVRNFSAKALGDIGNPAAIPLLAASLLDDFMYVREEVANSLVKLMGIEKTASLLMKLSREMQLERGRCAQLLGILGEKMKDGTVNGPAASGIGIEDLGMKKSLMRQNRPVPDIKSPKPVAVLKTGKAA